MIHLGLSVEEQVERGCRLAERRYGAKKYIAYFQSFTNTYAPPSQLKKLYDRALTHPGMVGLSVATRPDCINDEIARLLCSYKGKYMVWVELGLQSAHEDTLSRINRGHGVACFERALQLLYHYGLDICSHIILGLPGETHQMMIQTAIFLSRLPMAGLKIHLLYVVKDTPLASLYHKGGYRCLEREEYVELVVDFLELLPQAVIIHRLTGDPIGSELVAPLWALDKTKNLRRIRDRLEERDTWQGRLYTDPVSGKLDRLD